MNPLLQHLDIVALEIFALGCAFGAGAYAFALRSARKQINGLGARVTRVSLAVIHICPDAKREEVTRMILGEQGRGS